MLIFFKIIITNLYFFLYGKIINKYYFENNKNSNTELAIYGAIFVSFLALLINFFLPLNKTIATIIFIIPFFFLLKENLLLKKDFNFLLVSSFCVFLLIAFSNINRPDAGLYHLPYVQILNENKIIIGLSNLHIRFGHISIIQYLSAINNNYITGVNGILIPLASLATFIFIYFVSETLNFIKNNKELKINNIFCLFVLIYICFKINRYSGFGNDATAHLLFFYLISIFLKSQINYYQLNRISIIATYIFLNKVTLILAFIFPLIAFLNLKKNKFKILYSFSTWLILIWLLKNILISGCFVYPINKTCVYKLSWANQSETIKQNISAEAWAKGWPQKLDNSITQKEFSKSFNWIKAWSSNHLIYLLKIVIPYILFLMIILFLINYYKKDNLIKFLTDKKDKQKIFYSLLICSFGVLLFFLKFPLFRYGYSYLISLIIFLTSLLILSYDLSIVKKIFKYTLVFSLLIISSKQLIRIKNNFDTHSIWPNIEAHSPHKKNLQITEVFLNNNFKVFISKGECMYVKAPCTNSFKKNILHKALLNYDVIFFKEN